MDTNFSAPGSDRIEAIARRAGMERSLYLGEAIGHALAIAWNAFGALGALSAWVTRRGASTTPARSRAAE